MNASVTIFPVDRWRAALRAAWRVGIGVVVLMLCRAIARAIHWREMWAADRFALVAETALLVLFGLLGLALAAAGGRWLLLAVWSAETDVRIDAEAIDLRLGPFGRHRLDRARMRVEREPVGDADFPLPDDEPMVPRVMHPDLAGDVSDWIMRYSTASPADVAEAFAAKV